MLESGEPREVHHFCTLVGYGVTAINPWLTFDTVHQLGEQEALGGLSLAEAQKNYIQASVKA